ncbi:MAG: DUF6062 family protein [Spirochaetia bacterium]
MSAKYRLETIPVWEALSRGSECLLCELEAESERRNTEFFLGSSVMAPEVRVELNKHGFCPRHFHMLQAGTGKLGYALALATHIDDLLKRFSARGKRLIAAGNRRQAAAKASADLVDMLLAQDADCLMCDRIRHNLANYAYTIVKLFGTDGEFRQAFASSRGICLHHLPLVLKLGVVQLKPGEIKRWHDTVVKLVQDGLSRLGEELEQFTWQFDHNTGRATPETSQDSVARAVVRLAGYGPQRLP